MILKIKNYFKNKISINLLEFSAVCFFKKNHLDFLLFAKSPLSFYYYFHDTFILL